MPSIFSRKSKSSSRTQTRPPSGVPENFGHGRGGLTQLRRNEISENMPPSPQQNHHGLSPPPPQPQQTGSTPPLPQNGLPHVPRSNGSASMERQTNGQRQTSSSSHADATPAYANGRSSESSGHSQLGRSLSIGAGANNGRSTKTLEEQGSSNGRPTSSGNGHSSFWSMKPLRGPTLFPRRGFSTALNSTDLYWFGGKAGDSLHNDLAILDSATCTASLVSVHGNVPAPREGHAASFIGRTMFVFGGELADGRCDDNLYAYNMANHTWYKVPIQGNPLMGRKGHTAVSMGSKLYVFGGTVDGYYLQDLVSFDVRIAASQGARWTHIDCGTTVPPGRAGHSCSVHLNNIYVFGGMNQDKCFNDLWAFNIEEQRWTKVTPRGATPPARYGHASAVVDDCIFIMGGRSLKGEPLSDFFAYKISLQRWYTFQINASAWPHQIDPIFSVVKSRLLLYSGNLPTRLDSKAEPAIYSLDTSKIKIQPDGGSQRSHSNGDPQSLARSASTGATGGSPVSNDDQAQQRSDKARRHRSLMPPGVRQGSPNTNDMQAPMVGEPAGARATSMVGGLVTERALQQEQRVMDESSTKITQPQPRHPAINGIQATASESIESFEIVNTTPQPDEGTPVSRNTQSGSMRTRAHQRRSILLSQGLMPANSGSPGPAIAPTSSNQSSATSTSAVSPPLASQPDAPTSRDDKRLTIALRNRNSVVSQGTLSVSNLMSHESIRGLSDSPAIGGEGVLSTEDIPESALLPPSATFSTGAAGNTFDESDFKPSSLESLPPIADPAAVEELPELEAPRKMRHMSVSSEMKETVGKAWSSLESKYSQNRQLDATEIEASNIDPNLSIQSISNVENLLSQDATRVLNVLLSMRKELTEAKQQLATVSRVAIERVTEAERGRKAALQEAIYLKAKASALAAASPALVGKLNSHRIHELERLYANTLNDNDALRNQLANANLSLKQAQDALSEFKHDAELTRAQHRELEQLYAQAQRDEEERQAALERSRSALPDDAAAQTISSLEQKLVEKQTEYEALAGAERQRAERMDSALKSAKAATERAERVQVMLEESLAKGDRLETQAANLSADLEKHKVNAQRSEERAARFEQLWSDAKEEISAFGALRGALEQMEDKEKTILDLERKLSDAQERVRSLDRHDSNGAPVIQPRGSFASDASSSATAEQRIKEFQAAYLAAHRQWSEARDELLSLRTTLRETDDRRRDMETKLAERERELDDMHARLSAFTELLQEYAAKNAPRTDSTQISTEGDKEKLDKGAPNSALLMSDDEISVSNMLAAIQQLQRTSSIGSRPSADGLKAPAASDLVN